MNFFRKILILSFFVSPVFALAAPAGEVIHSFNVTARIDKSSQVWIDETINYDFGDLQKHGIYRNIPVKYKTDAGNNQTIKISNIHVADDFGKPYNFTTSYSGNDLVIKIGDADKLITGAHTYIISYTVDRALGYFKDFDELYWNATGNAWNVPIENTTASVYLPEEVASKDARISCYTGFVGSKEGCRTMINGNGDNVAYVYFSYFGTLQPKQGMTFAVGFPKGLVHEPTASENIWNTIKDNAIVALPIIVFFTMFYIWFKKGKDPKGRGTIVPEYESPEGLTPLEMSALRNQGLRDKDISAGIIFLATKGYLKITKIETQGLLLKSSDYVLTRLKDPASDLDPVLSSLLLGLCPEKNDVAISTLKNKFFTEIPKLKKSAMKSLVDKGYYPEDPGKTKTKYVWLAIAMFFPVWFLGFFKIMSALSAFSLFLSALITIIFAQIMPKVTKLGAEMKERIDGLKMYISVAEEERIKFHNAPAKNPELFEKLLPFAMVLGAEKEWSKQFEGILTAPPSWYSDSHAGMFSAMAFSHNISSFSTSVASTLSTAPGGHSGSGGGGFSGGGGGGGGGGSW